MSSKKKAPRASERPNAKVPGRKRKGKKALGKRKESRTPKGRASKIYQPTIRWLFEKSYKKGAEVVDVTRKQIDEAAKALGVSAANVGDVLYTYRYRRALPPDILEKAPEGKVWIIRGTGDGLYQFAAVDASYTELLKPGLGRAVIRIPNATPGIIEKYRLSDEQALLAVMRYNRLVDVFLGITCYSLQNHLRTKVTGIGQIETDEVYVGVDRHGGHYVVPVQAKGGSDSHSVVQIEQDFAMCAEKFPNAICRAVAAQFVDDDVIALFALRAANDGSPEVLAERHYKLIPPEELTDADLKAYRVESLTQV